jgi:hypothetical protein
MNRQFALLIALSVLLFGLSGCSGAVHANFNNNPYDYEGIGLVSQPSPVELARAGQIEKEGEATLIRAKAQAELMKNWKNDENRPANLLRLGIKNNDPNYGGYFYDPMFEKQKVHIDKNGGFITVISSYVPKQLTIYFENGNRKDYDMRKCKTDVEKHVNGTSVDALLIINRAPGH